MQANYAYDDGDDNCRVDATFRCVIDVADKYQKQLVNSLDFCHCVWAIEQFQNTKIFRSPDQAGPNLCIPHFTKSPGNNLSNSQNGIFVKQS